MRTNAAFADIVKGTQAWRFWTMLGWNDIKQRYRRTLIGPFWMTISMTVMVLALGLIYGSIFQMAIADYIFYLAAGMVTWFFMSSIIIEGTMAFITAESIIKQSRIPFTIFIYRVIWRNVIILLHNAVVVAIMFPWMRALSPITPFVLAAGFLIIAGNMFVMILTLAILATRFRDLPPVINSIVQVLFYVTPVLYEPSQLPPQLRLIAHYNPFYHIIDVLRRPLIGELPDLISYAVAIGTLVAGAVVTFLIFRRFRSRVPYWL